MQGARWGLRGSDLFVQHRRLSRLRPGEFGGQVNTMTAGHMVSQQFKGSQSLFPFFLGPVLMLVCPLLVRLAMDSGQPGLCHWSDTSIRTSISLFNNLSYANSSVGSLCSSCSSESLGLPLPRWFTGVPSLDNST